MIFKPYHIYIKIKTNNIWAKHLESQTIVELSAHQPFTTKRLLVGNFDAALFVIKNAINQTHSKTLKWVSPKVVIHPMEYLEEGLSPVEKRLFLDLAACSGALERRVWEGTELADTEVIGLFWSKASQ
jgi:rod shape-determining protein MreB